MGNQYSDRFIVTPLTVTFGETEFIDGVTLDKTEFYQKLEESPVLPRTSQATPDSFVKVFRDLEARGEEAVVITVTSKLSGTYQSARIAAEDFPNVRVVDSRNVSIGSGVLAEYALQCAEQGMQLDELTEHLIQNATTSVCWPASRPWNICRKAEGFPKPQLLQVVCSTSSLSFLQRTGNWSCSARQGAPKRRIIC